MQAGTPPNTTTKYSSQLIEGSLTEIRVMAIEQVQLTNQEAFTGINEPGSNY